MEKIASTGEVYGGDGVGGYPPPSINTVMKIRDIINVVETAQRSPAMSFEADLRSVAEGLGIIIDVARHDDDSVSLENLNVPVEARGGGMAHTFMTKLDHLATDHSVRVWVYPEPYEGNIETDALRSFYNKHGFVTDPEDDGYLVLDRR